MPTFWPFRRTARRRPPVRERASSYGPFSISDPVLAAMLGINSHNMSGQAVTEQTALTLSGVYRAVNLVAVSIAGLPLRTLETDPETGVTVPAGSFLDNPAGPDRQTPFEWCELVADHLLLQGEAFLQHVYNRGGAICGLNPVHPLAMSVDEDPDVPGGKRLRADLGHGEHRDFDSTTMTHIVGMSLDGVRGIGPISLARNSIGTGLAADRAAAKLFANGALISGMVTPDDDLDEDEAQAVKDSLQAKMLGTENAGDIAVINRRLKFTPWSLSAADAQFLQSRVFQIEEIGRWWGVPPHLLGQTEKATSWGQGIAEQNRGLARYTLAGHTTRIQQRLSRLLVPSKRVEFDYTAFTAASPEDEIRLLIEQVNAGLLTLNEARRIRNLPPVAGGDLPRTPPGAMPPAPAGAQLVDEQQGGLADAA